MGLDRLRQIAARQNLLKANALGFSELNIGMEFSVEVVDEPGERRDEQNPHHPEFKRKAKAAHDGHGRTEDDVKHF